MVIAKAVAALLMGALLACAGEYEDLFQEAAALSQQGKFDQAIAKYKAALRLRPGAPEALNNLAVMYYQAREYGDAWETASRIWKSHPEMSSAALIAGLSAVQLKKPADAIAPFERALAGSPDNRDAILGLAAAHLALNQLPESAKLYERQTAHSPNDADAWYGLAICYERMAEGASRKLAKMRGGAFYSKRLLGEFLSASGDAQLAREAFGESAGAAADASPEAATEYARARNLAEKSRNAFQHLIAVAPESWQANLFFGDVERQHRNFQQALGHYEKAASQKPDNVAALLGIGTVHWEMGEFDQAEESLRQALRLNPDALQVTFELANIAVRKHQDDRAIPLLKKYLTQQPDAFAARADLGRAYLHLGEFTLAAEELGKATPADTQGDIHYQLATALRKLGRDREADEAMKQSSQIRKAELKREQRLQSGK